MNKTRFISLTASMVLAMAFTLFVRRQGGKGSKSRELGQTLCPKR